MSKKASDAQGSPVTNERKSPPTYYVEHQYGRMLACKHVFNGRTFVQLELDTLKGEDIAALLIESDIFSVIKSDAAGGFSIDPGIVMSHLVRKKLIRKFLAAVLTNEDGTATNENDFIGKMDAFMALAREVWDAFFTLNPAVLQTIGPLLISVLGTAAAGGQLVAMFLAGVNSSGPLANTARKGR